MPISTNEYQKKQIVMNRLKDASHYLKVSAEKPTDKELEVYNDAVNQIEQFSEAGSTYTFFLATGSYMYLLKMLKLKGFQYKINTGKGSRVNILIKWNV